MTTLDPTACYREMTDAMDRYDFPTAREHAEALERLLAAVGARPADPPAAELADTLKRVLARTLYPD